MTGALHDDMATVEIAAYRRSKWCYMYCECLFHTAPTTFRCKVSNTGGIRLQLEIILFVPE